MTHAPRPPQTLALPRAVATLALKDLRLMWRDRVGLVFTVWFPVCFAALFGAVLSGPGVPQRAPLALVDRDGSAESAALVARLLAAPEARAWLAPDEDHARRQVLAKRAAAALIIDPGFAKPDPPTHRAPGAAAPAALALRLLTDPSRAPEAAALRGVILPAALTARWGAPALAGPPRALIHTEPLGPGAPQLGAPPPAGGGYAVSVPQGMLWGVMGAAMAFAGSLVAERRRGTLARLRVTPAGLTGLLVAKHAACAVTCMGVCALMVLLGVGLAGLRPVDWPLLVAASACTSLGFAGLMLLIAGLATSEPAASGMGWGVLMLLAMLGGATVPRALMPPWLSDLAGLSPVAWALDAFEHALWRGGGWPAATPQLVRLAALGVLAAAAGAPAARYLGPARRGAPDT